MGDYIVANDPPGTPYEDQVGGHSTIKDFTEIGGKIYDFAPLDVLRVGHEQLIVPTLVMSDLIALLELG